MSSSVDASTSWVNTFLGEIIELKYGKSLSAKVRDGDGFPVFGSNGVVGRHSTPLVNGAGLIVGRKGTFGAVHYSTEPFFPIDTTYYVDEFSGQPIKYWYYLLRYLPLDQLNRSTAIPGLNRDDAYSQTVPLPSVAEQKAIADKLDTLLAQVENTKARLERIPQILKRFRQSVLAAAVSGKLTSFASVEEKELGDIAEIVSGVAFKKAQYSEHGSRLLQIANVGYGEVIWDKKAFIGLDLAAEFDRFGLMSGDIVMALNRPITNDSLKVGRISETDLPATLYQRVARLRGKRGVLMSYLFLQMQSSEFRRQVQSKLKGSDQPYINTSDLARLSILVPEIEAQKEIVDRVEVLLVRADRIEKQVRSALTRLGGLNQTIFAKAFRGGLTEQWRQENPNLINGEYSAKALLAKIQAEKPAKRGRS